MSVGTRIYFVLLGFSYIAALPAAVIVTLSISWWVIVAALTAVPCLLWGISFISAVKTPPLTDDAATDRVKAQVAAVCSFAEIAVPVVYLSHRTQGPSLTWCNGQARLGFPTAWAQTLSAEELRAYVAHELCHQEQPERRKLQAVNSLSQLPAGLSLGLAFLAASHWDRIDRLTWTFAVISLVPIVVTGVLTANSFVFRGTLLRLEVAADEQAIAWGASREALASALDRTLSPELTVRQPLYARLLQTILTSGYPRHELSLRSQRLRA